MGFPYVFFAYVGPDVALPVASALAGVIGFLLMVGRAPFRMAARGIRGAARRVRTVVRGPDPGATRPPDEP
jgi:hypothetical protein